MVVELILLNLARNSDPIHNVESTGRNP